MKTTDVVIVGAGVARLVAGRELAKAGKKVVMLEARDRVGGRVWPIAEEEFGFQVQAGAEFVHGPAPITKSLIKEAGLTYIPTEEGERWNTYSGKLTKEEELFDKKVLHDKLRELKEDVPIAIFFEKYFPEEKYSATRKAIIEQVKNYDAADPYKISTFSLRDEWLGDEKWQQGKIKEGYGPLLDFLKSECVKNAVEINFNQEVKSVEIDGEIVSVLCSDGKRYESEKVLITLPLPVLAQINFNPPVPEKMAAASKIGFGSVIKILLLFKDRFWVNASENDLDKLLFLRSSEEVPIWWTQYPELNPLFTGWIAGPRAEELKNTSFDEILNFALTSLSNIFKIDPSILKNGLLKSRVVNWPSDLFALGAYSYSTVGAPKAYEELRKPIGDKIFFAGEALFNGKETATVEGALVSGLEMAKKMLNN